MTPAALFVPGEGGAPYALRRGELGAVPVGHVANALGGQGVANVSPRFPLCSTRPQLSTRLRIIWLRRPSETPSQAGQVLTGDHRVVGDEVERPLLSRADAEGRRSPHHPLGVGNGRTLPLRRLGSRPSAAAGVGAHRLQRVVRESEQPRGFAPEAQVPSCQRVSGLHGNVAVTEVVVDAEPRRPPKLPCARHKDQYGAGTPPVAVLRYGPQPVLERPPPQGQPLGAPRRSCGRREG